MKKFDFSGYATRNDIKCSDGRTIRKDAFKEQDGLTVPLVWQHMHNDPGNILGHATLENRNDGVYAFCKFNDSDAAKNAKLLVEHQDITALSIFANGLLEKSGSVLHGAIKEVSLVLSGANPGAMIDNLAIQHSDGSYDSDLTEAIIYSGEEISMAHAETEKTVKDVFDTLNDEQKDVVYFMIGAAIEEATGEDDDEDITHSDEDDDEDDDEDETIKHSDEGGTEMKKNVFENLDGDKKGATLTHAQLTDIISDAKKCGSFKEAFLAHAVTYGIENIDLLFPDAKSLSNSPDFISRRQEWVQGIISGSKHSPFSRIKSMTADITLDTARAKGYVKGTMKKEEFFALAKRVTGPTTIYKKQKLDRDDIIDITDLDVVAWLKDEMRVMLDEEIARAALIGDGREVDDEDKINETCIRPIAFDDALYAHPVTVPADVSGDSIIEAIIRARTYYKGTGTPSFYTTDGLIIDLLLLKDKMGRRLYNTEAELASALRVAKLIPVEPMGGIAGLLGVIVNINDYTMGADKGGDISMFDDFDIDYNQYKYLIETRMSGALTKPKSALVIKRAAGTEVTPTVPTFVASTGVLTIPSKTGVAYTIDGVAASAGAQTAIEGGVTVEVVAAPTTGYYFPHNTDADWEFTSELVAG